jgi:transposase InsO family protein
MDIFLLFGAPHILQSDNGSEFTAQIISDMKELWPELVIVHGKPCHPQSQGSVERANYHAVNDYISMRSTWPRAESSLDKIGRTTTPFVIGRTRLR